MAYRFDGDDEPPYPGSTCTERFMDGTYVNVETRTPRGESSRDGGGSYSRGWDRPVRLSSPIRIAGGGFSRGRDSDLFGSRLGRSGGRRGRTTFSDDMSDDGSFDMPRAPSPPRCRARSPLISREDMRRGARRSIFGEMMGDVFGSRNRRRSRSPPSPKRRRPNTSGGRREFSRRAASDSEEEFDIGEFRGERSAGAGGFFGGGGLGGGEGYGGGRGFEDRRSGGSGTGDAELLRRYFAGDRSAACCQARVRHD
jgi:hypothetical protein